MTAFSEPTKWAQSLGATANADVIPDEAGATDVDISKIFPAIFSVPLAQGGKAIPRRTLNGLLKLLGDWIYYIQNGGIASYSASFDYAVGRVVLYTDGNLYKCIQANGATDPKTPTDLAYWTKIPTLSDFDEIGFQTGDIKIHTTSTVPNGWLLCNGAGISRTTFSNLFAKIGATYGAGDGSTTFNLPDLRDRYIIGANTNALGTYVAEQLPNITGAFSYKVDSGGTCGVGVRHAVGAFAEESIAPLGTLQFTSTYSGSLSIGMNAHNSNSVYTNNGRVYPASLALNFIIKT